VKPLSTDSPASAIVTGVVGTALVGAVVFLAWIDPGSRSLIGGVLTSALMVAVGFFFSQRSQSTGTASTLNGMASMSAAIAAGTPGPTGAKGEPGVDAVVTHPDSHVG
jgi:hypothetical protein